MNSKTMQWIKSRNCDKEGKGKGKGKGKEDSSQSLRCVHCLKVELFFEMLHAKL